jgi:solute carrier family 35 protein E1
MQSYPYPLTVALTSLVSIPLYASPLLRIWNIRQRTISSAYLCKFIVPIAIGKAIAVSSAQFSLWKVPVSYVHTGW